MSNFDIFFTDQEREAGEEKERQQARAKISPIPKAQRTTPEEEAEAFEDLISGEIFEALNNPEE